MIRQILCASISLVFATPLVAEPTRQIIDSHHITALIKKLSSDSPAERENAASTLANHPECEPAVKALLNNPDADIRQLAEQILRDVSHIKIKRTERILNEYRASGRLDLFAETLAAWDEKELPDEWWQILGNVGMDLLSRDGNTPPRTNIAANTDWNSWAVFSRYKNRQGFQKIVPNNGIIEMPSPTGATPYSVHAACRADVFLSLNKIDPFPGWHGLAAVSKQTSINTLTASFILCGGTVTIREGGSSLIVCGHHCNITKNIADCVVITRGNLRITEVVANCYVLAGGDVEIVEGPVNNCTIRAVGKVTLEKNRVAVNSDIRANDPKALDGIRFFELSDLGLAVKAGKNELLVTRVQKDSPLAHAGLRGQDILTHVGTRQPTDLESLRQAFRRAYVQRDAVLRVLRDGQPVQFAVRFPDPLARDRE